MATTASIILLILICYGMYVYIISDIIFRQSMLEGDKCTIKVDGSYVDGVIDVLCLDSKVAMIETSTGIFYTVRFKDIYKPR